MSHTSTLSLPIQVSQEHLHVVLKYLLKYAHCINVILQIRKIDIEY